MRWLTLFLLIPFSGFSQVKNVLNFIENKGQWNKDIDFQAPIPGGRLSVSAKGFSVLLLDREELENRHLERHGVFNESDGHRVNEPVNGHYFQINLLHANPNAKPIPQNPLNGHHNYFIGDDVNHWASQARAFATIVYTDIYEGIDFRVSSVGTNLKYDFIVRPGADPSQIKLEYCGVDGLEKKNDDLEVHTSVGTVVELKPFSYQGSDKNKYVVSSAYTLDRNIVSFSFPDEYDECKELVIDPLLIFSTYSGSTADNWGSTATPGEHGTLYSSGVTHQDLGGFFPATPGAFQTANGGKFDMAVIKYDSAGTTFLYATHLGGINNDSPESLVVDKLSGDLLMLGISSSPDYPTSGNAHDRSFNLGTTISNHVLNTDDMWDIVLTRLSSDGNLIGSTFLGGSGNDGLNLPKPSGGHLVANYGDEMRGDIITDETGHVYISSVTASSDLPIVNGFDHSFNGATDGFVAKLSPDLSEIIWSSYVGGSGLDAAYSIKLDNNQNIVLAGGTTSANFPVTPGSYQSNFKGIVDGWIARISSDGGQIINATFTGTNSFDQVYFIDLNASGKIFCYGQTAGQMPTTPGVYKNANSGQFLQKFNASLSALEFSTVFGSGSSNGLVIPNISPTAFLVNDCDNIYMAGWGGFVNSDPSTGFWQSSTMGMPITTDAHQATTSGSDFYFMVLNGDATELVYSTYLGGNFSKTHVDGGTSRFDKYGIVYHSVCSGCTFGNATGFATSDFPTSTNAKSRINPSENCNNAAFKFDLSSLSANFDTNNVDLTMAGFNNVCYPDSIVFQNFSTGGKVITWDFDDGTVITQTNTDPRFLIHQYKAPGQYKVKLKIFDLSTCSQTDSITKTINYFKAGGEAGEDAIACEAIPFRLTATGGNSYQWVSDDGMFSSSEQSPWVQPDSSTSYFVTIFDTNGCSRKDTLNLAINHNVRANLQSYRPDFSDAGYNNVCFPGQILFKNRSVNGQYFVWDFGDGKVPIQINDSVPLPYQFQNEGVYQVKLRALNPTTCNQQDVATKTIHYFKDKITVVEDGDICEGASFELSASGGNVYAWSSENNTFTSSVASPVVKPLESTRYFVTVTDANNCSRKDTVQVTVVDSVELKWQHFVKGSCADRPSIFVENQTLVDDDVTFHFDFGDGTTSDELAIEHVYENDGMYAVKLIAQRKFCSYEESVQLPFYTLRAPNVFTPDDSPGLNDNFEIVFSEDRIAPAEIGLRVKVSVVDRWGKIVFESDDYRNDWKGQGLAGGIYYFQVQVGDLVACKDWLHIVK